MTGNPVLSELWAAEYPKKNEACVELLLGANRVALVSSACNTKALLVCEVSTDILNLFY
jgi:hypothetical protein